MTRAITAGGRRDVTVRVDSDSIPLGIDFQALMLL